MNCPYCGGYQFVRIAHPLFSGVIPVHCRERPGSNGICDKDFVLQNRMKMEVCSAKLEFSAFEQKDYQYSQR